MSNDPNRSPEATPRGSAIEGAMPRANKEATPPPPPAVRTEVDVMFFDTDCAAVVHNIAYLRFIETARTYLAAELGMGLSDMAETGQFPVVVRTEIDYRRPAKLGDHLLIEGELESISRSRFWCSFRITRPACGTLLTTCRQMLALVQMPAGKAIRLPEEWAVKYPHLLQRQEAKIG